MLCLLVRKSGSLISKDELLEKVWEGAFVEENNLDKTISALRRTLGEKRGERVFIETVRKQGYRFVAEVARVENKEEVLAENSPVNSLPPTTAAKISDNHHYAFERRGNVLAVADWQSREFNKLTWTPDGNNLIVIAKDANNSPYQIWQVSYPNGAWRRITNDLNNYSKVDVSADGKTLITAQEKSYAHLWLMPFNDTSRARQLTDGQTYKMITKIVSKRSFFDCQGMKARLGRLNHSHQNKKAN